MKINEKHPLLPRFRPFSPVQTQNNLPIDVLSEQRCSLSKSSIASAFASSVLPTPVGPAKRKEPVGCVRRLRRAAERSTARLTASAASSWPTTRCFRDASRPSRRA